MNDNEKAILFVASETHLSEKQVRATIDLLESGSTIPFIARYRKEKTGSLDEVKIKSVRDVFKNWNDVHDRRRKILDSLQVRNLLTQELKSEILGATSLQKLEDIYLPYRPKKRTWSTIAKEKGLEPLAHEVYTQKSNSIDYSDYVNPQKEVFDISSVKAGVSDIIAEWISENTLVREKLRSFFLKKGILQSKVVKKKQSEASKYQDYFKFSELLYQIPAHRFHAIMRGHRDGFLRIRVLPDEKEALAIIEGVIIKNNSDSAQFVCKIIRDAYIRLLHPSMETDALSQIKNRSDINAIKVFADNLKGLLLASPLGQKKLIAIDPGFRTGCKVVVLDEQGTFLKNTTIYPSLGKDSYESAKKTVQSLCDSFHPDAIAVGNGTAGRETEIFLRDCQLSIPVISVNESGASIYSGSDLARQEFPDLDLTVRGAISIGRRLQDPLAELVKIDPKSIGVGQYQHDVNQTLLQKSLDDVVVSCVNAVGVEINSASESLLAYVSGIGPQIAKNIVSYRFQKGPFKSRQDLMSVPRLGAFVFEQAAGFLRVRGSSNILDESSVHPERYPLVEKMADDLNCSISDMIKKAEIRKNVPLNQYVSEDIGLPTLQDILNELAKPGRDPRPIFELFCFSEEVHQIDDLIVGMKLPGIVTNVTNFGAFIDIGVHQDGLVHISHLADHFVKDPTQEVVVSQKVKVTVLSVDKDRKRIALSMKSNPI